MRRSLIALLLASALTLGACASSTTSTVPTPRVASVNLTTQSYKAADDLMKFSRALIAPQAPVVVTTLSDVSRLETSSAFGRMVSEQIAGRLVEKGYRVQTLTLRNSLNIKQGLNNAGEAGEYLSSRDISALSGQQQASAAVIGTYAVADSAVAVNVKLVDVSTGRIVSSRDYEVPRTADIDALLNDANAREFSGSFFGKSWAY